MAESRLRLLQLEHATTAGSKTYVVTANTSGVPEWESLANLVPNFETLTSLTYNASTGNFEYSDEDGSTNNVDAPVLEKTDITITAARSITLSGGGTLQIIDSNGTPVGLEYAGDYTSTYNNLSLIHKGYVDSLVSGASWKDYVVAASTANIDLTTGGLLTVDGVSLADGDRVLVKDQTDASENGIYEAASGAWSRASDADTWDEHVSAAVYVSEGSTQSETQWVCISDEGGTLGTTNLDWTQFFGASAITASNENNGGVGVFITKNNNNLEFKGINAGSSKITVTNDGANNEIDIDVAEGQVNHDALLNFVANEHIDHSGVSITGGTGLSGGGDITASRTINLNHLGLENLSDPNDDRIVYWDDSDGASNWLDIGAGLSINGTTDTLDVDMLGLEDLTDPGADRIFFWNDGGGISDWLVPNTGIAITGNNLNVIPDSTVQQVTVENNGTVVGSRSRLNFIPGTDIALTIAEDGPNNEIDITIDYDGGATSNVYQSMTDGTTTSTASGADTFKFRSANSLLSVAVQNDDATHGDNLLLTINEGNISHANIAGVVANEHIDHSSVTLSAGVGLSGGGDITANRTFAVDKTVETFSPSSGSTVTVVGTLPTSTALIEVSRNGALLREGASNDYTVNTGTGVITFNTAFGGFGGFSAMTAEEVKVEYFAA